MQTLQVTGETRRARDEISDHSHDKRVSLKKLQEPIVVAQQRARLDGNGSNHAGGPRYRLVPLRKGRLVDGVAWLGPRNAPRASGIEQVDVCIDHRQPWHRVRRGAPRERVERCCECPANKRHLPEEFATVHTHLGRGLRSRSGERFFSRAYFSF